MTQEKRKRKAPIAVVAVFLILAIANYIRLPHEGIRAIDFVRILAIGMLTGVLLVQFVQLFKKSS